MKQIYNNSDSITFLSVKGEIKWTKKVSKDIELKDKIKK